VVAVVAASLPALAAQPATCPVDSPLVDAAQHLRAASLDLRGTVPAFAEYQGLPKNAQQVPDQTLDAWLAAPEFAAQAVRRHRDLLWNNISASGGRFTPVSMNLSLVQGVWYRPNLAPSVRVQNVPCKDEPATYTAQGSIVWEDMPDGTKREGWVWVNPYWAPQTQIKVCAYDAQDDVVSPAGTFCGGPASTQDLACGCGPNLHFCQGAGSQAMLADSFSEALDRQIHALVLDNRPYTDLFTETVAWVNGPIVHFYQWQADEPQQVRMVPLALDPTVLPKLEFTDRDKWVKVQLPPFHAGILTSPAFLVRFQSNRARANRFYNAFLCQPFQAPVGGIPVAGVAAISEPDLQKRDGCKYCHVLLEPSAAYWGRWTENGGGFLTAAEFPPQRKDCLQCAMTGLGCTVDCTRYYLTKAYTAPEKTFLGWLKAYNFRLPQHVKNVEHGPKLLAMTALADNRLPKCVAWSTAEWLLDRTLQPEEAPWAETLSVQFAASNYNWRKLVKSVVQSDVYRRRK
jgi:hypothetical protein